MSYTSIDIQTLNWDIANDYLGKKAEGITGENFQGQDRQDTGDKKSWDFQNKTHKPEKRRLMWPVLPHSSRCGTTLPRRPSGCSSAGLAADPGTSTHRAAWQWSPRLTSSGTPLTSAGCLGHTLQSTRSNSPHIFYYSMQKRQKK